MVIFKSKQKKSECDLKARLSGKRLYLTEKVKYLVVKLIQVFAVNDKPMIFALNGIAPTFFFSK